MIRDPRKTLVDQQLNGGVIQPLDEKDWELILPYLEENERLFNIKIDDLLTVDGKMTEPAAGVPQGGAAYDRETSAGDKVADDDCTMS